jgi:hypothetical protein
VLEKVTSVIGTIGVVVSLVLIAWQNRQLTKQTKINNEVGSTTAAYSALERIHQVSQIMVDRPETQPYFTKNAQLPADPLERDQILMIAQALADTIDYGLMVCDLRAHMQSYQGWPAFAVNSMTNSVALRQVVEEHPEYWPRLNRQWREYRREREPSGGRH